ncbi:c(7)-type cytochrome triheme domain-containing protein [Candidatus Thiodiazotropha sp. CDECU1]|uniref:c(7)-type cytochrome triheme domain-containing protein n=1 Tax=Candidatus Thiodiazotropha sp. CDECU1 TaxID=3065865 RepID=UPI00292EE474|nr:c(7)-type cytochrome triheme domain-containing protein [Candidatus Thiodiazotropha sp. CDECU1]
MVIRVISITLVISCSILIAACSTETKKLFFDIQPPTAKELAEQELNRQTALIKSQAMDLSENQSGNMSSAFFYPPDDNAPRPDIESIKEWDKVKKILPKDDEKNIDWSYALEQGMIRPRPGKDLMTLWATAFQWDFIIKAEEREDDAFFPHSAHTVWLGCKNCHNPSLYPYKRNPATMKEMKRGASCGACHGRKKVSFSLKACDRCHINSDDEEEEEEEDEE